jgi:hypothetical protein
MKITLKELKKIIKEVAEETMGEFTLILSPTYIRKTMADAPGPWDDEYLGDVSGYDTGASYRDPVGATVVGKSVHLKFPNKDAAQQWLEWNQDEGIMKISKTFWAAWADSTDQAVIEGKHIRMLDY